MDESEQFFVSETIRHARTLPFSECIKFLSGFLLTVDQSHPATAPLRSIYTALVDSDQQLDLIQIGQLKLKLVSAEVRPSGSDRPRRRAGRAS